MNYFKSFIENLAEAAETEEIVKSLEGFNGTIVDGRMKVVTDQEAKATKYDATLCRPVSWGQKSVDSVEELCAGCQVPVWVSRKTIEVTGKDCPRLCPACMLAKMEADKQEEA